MGRAMKQPSVVTLGQSPCSPIGQAGARHAAVRPLRHGPHGIPKRRASSLEQQLVAEPPHRGPVYCGRGKI